ncbi:MAG TPA: oxygen-independent coproporphyrinogen III oxidase [Nitrospiria bacterium]|nr:oxygen-independent coproporphyrinogen III oxidase [Nitrospiria bacterium]
MALAVSLDLLARHDKAGPRYTSYPTAPVWSERFGPADYLDEIRRTNTRQPPAPLSLYLHIPFCNTLCYFCGCSMMVTKDEAKMRGYVDCLCQEIDRIADLLAPGRPVHQLQWGGGTPNYLTDELIERLVRTVTRRFTFAGDAEIGLEVDPRDTRPGQITWLRGLGFNRLSLGVQDFDPKVQQAVNRLQTEALTRRVIEEARSACYHSLNIDLIYGLPYQTAESFGRTLDILIDIGPDRLAVFNYAHVPSIKRHQRLIPSAALPPPAEKLRMLKLTIERLTGAGYVYIGMDHFARPDDKLCVAQRARSLHRNFQGYTTKAGCDLYAFGATAISMVGDCYAQNLKDLTAYEETVRAGGVPTLRGYRLNMDDRIRRHVIMRLLCDLELDKRDVESRFGLEFDDYFATELHHLVRYAEEGLIDLQADRVVVTEAGRLLARNLAMEFDAYLRDESADQPLFSRTI